MVVERKYHTETDKQCTHQIAQSILSELGDDFIEQDLGFKSVTLFNEHILFEGSAEDNTEVHISVSKRGNHEYKVYSVKYHLPTGNKEIIESQRLTASELNKTLVEHKTRLGITRCLSLEN